MAVIVTDDWSAPDAKMGYGTTNRGPDAFSALIFLRPRPLLFGGGPSSPANPPLVLIGSVPTALANPERKFAEGADP